MASLQNATMRNKTMGDLRNSRNGGPRCNCNKSGGGSLIEVSAGEPLSSSHNGVNKIQVSLGKPGGIVRVTSNRDLSYKESHSDVNINATSRSNKPMQSMQSMQCINPEECERIKFMGAGGGNNTNAEVSPLTLENTLSDALASVNIANTFEEVEEMVEIHECSKLQRRLLALVEDKKRRLETRAHRRQAELLERKAEFTRSVLNKLGAEREEMAEMHNTLINILQDSTGGNDSKNISGMRFSPDAESSRRVENSNRTMRGPTHHNTCQCKGNNR